MDYFVVLPLQYLTKELFLKSTSDLLFVRLLANDTIGFQKCPCDVTASLEYPQQRTVAKLSY